MQTKLQNFIDSTFMDYHVRANIKKLLDGVPDHPKTQELLEELIKMILEQDREITELNDRIGTLESENKYYADRLCR